MSSVPHNDDSPRSSRLDKHHDNLGENHDQGPEHTKHHHVPEVSLSSNAPSCI